jgi:hypothetical protein
MSFIQRSKWDSQSWLQPPFRRLSEARSSTCNRLSAADQPARGRSRPAAKPKRPRRRRLNSPFLPIPSPAHPQPRTCPPSIRPCSVSPCLARTLPALTRNLISYTHSSIFRTVPPPDHIAPCNYASRRRLFVLLLLAITLFAQSAALISEHQQHHATEHCCLLCHVSLPFLQATAPLTIAPLTSVQWLAAIPRFESFCDVFLATNSSRGPPTYS